MSYRDQDPIPSEPPPSKRRTALAIVWIFVFIMLACTTIGASIGAAQHFAALGNLFLENTFIGIACGAFFGVPMVLMAWVMR